MFECEGMRRKTYYISCNVWPRSLHGMSAGRDNVDRTRDKDLDVWAWPSTLSQETNAPFFLSIRPSMHSSVSTSVRPFIYLLTYQTDRLSTNPSPRQKSQYQNVYQTNIVRGVLYTCISWYGKCKRVTVTEVLRNHWGNGYLLLPYQVGHPDSYFRPDI